MFTLIACDNITDYIGTYYAYNENGEKQSTDYIALNKDSWETGESSGRLEVKYGVIYTYIESFDKEDVLFYGTVDNGMFSLTLNGKQYYNFFKDGSYDNAKGTSQTKLYFGTYPQTKVTDNTIINTLTTSAGTLPTSTNSQLWTSYGYYISGNISNYMWYIDKEYNGDKYRGVYFTNYRPNYCGSSSSMDFSYQDDNGYNTSTVYWFKYEPIKWRILNESDNEALILADLAIDSQQFNYDGSYNNNYKESTIRKWLNETFYNTAFNSYEKELIKTTNVDNNETTTSDCINNYGYENTDDKVFLLSHKEATTYFTSNRARQMKSSDYAKSQGCWQGNGEGYAGNCCWWLRSPNTYHSELARFVISVGLIPDTGYVYTTTGGVLPALVIRLDNQDSVEMIIKSDKQI